MPKAGPVSIEGIGRIAVSTIVFGALLFLLAGTIRWPAAWIYLAILLSVLGGYSLIVARLHPDLLDERKRPPTDAKSWDRPFVAFIGVVGPLALLVVSGLDHRFHWSPPLPAVLVGAGLFFVACGGALTNYAVAHNRFFSALVRVQHDRGHRVVDTGPYQVVRHPGYVGSILHMFGTAVALGSLWALGVAFIVSVVIGIRTDREDRMLHEELEGYAEYARHVPYRLIPWFW